jgi:hypothetical protein
MTRSRVSEPWRQDQYLDKINNIKFFGSVGSGNESQRYWVMRVGKLWVSSEGHVNSTANSCMKEVRLSLYLQIYGKERVPNLSFWAHHKDNDGNTIDNILKKYFENEN